MYWIDRQAEQGVSGRSFRLWALCAVSTLAMFAVATSRQGAAQTSAPSNSKLIEATERREQARANLESNRKYLDENRQRVGTIKEVLARLNQERAELNANLISTGEKVKQTEAKMTAIEDRLSKLESQERTLRTSLNAQHKSIGRLLSAIQRMGRNPPPVMITQRSDALAMVRSAMLLARAFPKLRGDAMVLAKQLQTLVTLMSGIRKESDQLHAEAKTLNEAQTRLSYLLQTKRKSLGDRSVELAEVERTVKVIGRNVESLEELIGKLDPAIDRETKIGREIEAEARRKAIAQAEAEAVERARTDAEKLKKLQLAMNIPKPGTDDAASLGSPAIQPAGIKPPDPDTIAPRPAVSLVPKSGPYIGDTARISPAIPFHLAKGQLPMPAAGEIETQFGEPVPFGGRSKGLIVKTRHGAQITSPTDGWVVYAGKFRTYGQLLIIRAGEGYHVLLAGMSRIDVQSGQFMLAAEPVGTMKSSPGGQSEDDKPRLYVEFRKDGRPINPRPWWSASSNQKVQG